MSCFKSNKILYDCYATILMNVYIYLLFVGEGYLALVPSCLPHLRRLVLSHCKNVRNEYVFELEAAEPGEVFRDCIGNVTVKIRIKDLEITYRSRIHH